MRFYLSIDTEKILRPSRRREKKIVPVLDLLDAA